MTWTSDFISKDFHSEYSLKDYILKSTEPFTTNTKKRPKRGPFGPSRVKSFNVIRHGDNVVMKKINPKVHKGTIMGTYFGILIPLYGSLRVMVGV